MNDMLLLFCLKMNQHNEHNAQKNAYGKLKIVRYHISCKWTKKYLLFY